MQITSTICGLANGDHIINHDVNIPYNCKAFFIPISLNFYFIDNEFDMAYIYFKKQLWSQSVISKSSLIIVTLYSDWRYKIKNNSSVMIMDLVYFGRRNKSGYSINYPLIIHQCRLNYPLIKNGSPKCSI